jgi:hypothetical protein
MWPVCRSVVFPPVVLPSWEGTQIYLTQKIHYIRRFVLHSNIRIRVRVGVWSMITVEVCVYKAAYIDLR